MSTKQLFLILSLIFPSEALSVQLPKELLYKGKNIDPLCLEFPEDSSSIRYADISVCSPSSSRPGFKIKSNDAPEGFVGYEYTFDEAYNISYSYFKYLGKINNLPVIFYKRADGGTGRFSGIYYLKREGDIVYLIKDGPSGDRQRGGIINAKVDNNQLTYSQWLTPTDLVALADKSINKKEYDLPFCAICGIAIAHYKNEALETVELQDNMPNAIDPNTTHQCYYKIIGTYIKDRKKKLSPKELESLVERFKKECVKEQ